MNKQNRLFVYQSGSISLSKSQPADRIAKHSAQIRIDTTGVMTNAGTACMTNFFTAPDGCRFCYALHGAEGLPRLLYVQGSMGDLRRSMAVLTFLSRRFRVLAYDHRGMGRSCEFLPRHRHMCQCALPLPSPHTLTAPRPPPAPHLASHGRGARPLLHGRLRRRR